jgi:hypothetical protein
MSGLSEAKAMQKICPILPPRTLTQPGSDPYYEAEYCLGSNCMAWRWSAHTAPDNTNLGYCGLAGKPYGAR